MGVLKIRSGGAWIPVAQGVGIASPGLVGYAMLASDQSIAGTSVVDLTGMSITFTAIAGHTYKTTIKTTMSKLTAGGNVALNLSDVSNNNIDTQTVQAVTGDIIAPMLVMYENNLSGAATRKARVSTNVAGLTVHGGSTYHTSIAVEDITTTTSAGVGVVAEARTYTPTIGSMNPGVGGYNSARYSYVGQAGVGGVGQLMCAGNIFFGTSGQVFPATDYISLPAGFQFTTHGPGGGPSTPVGQCVVYDATGPQTLGMCHWAGGAAFRFGVEVVSGTYSTYNTVDHGASRPMAFAAGDYIGWTINTLAVRV